MGKERDLHACSMASGSGSYLGMQVGCYRSCRPGQGGMHFVLSGFGDQFWVQMVVLSLGVSAELPSSFHRQLFSRAVGQDLFLNLPNRLYLGSACWLSICLPQGASSSVDSGSPPRLLHRSLQGQALGTLLCCGRGSCGC